ncbi:MAG: type II CAAX endopeptidase family protein [Pseudolysinimonas sp.]
MSAPAPAAEPAPEAWTPPPGWIPTPQGWVPPPPLIRAQRPPATAGPLPFHRLFRGLAGFAWWRPLVAIGVGFAVYVVTSTLFVLGFVIFGVATGTIDLGTTTQQATDALYALADIDAASPFSLLFALGSVALLLPSALIGQLVAGLRPLAVRHSVAFRIRWRWFAVSLIPAFITVIAGIGVPAVVWVAATGTSPFGPVSTEPGLLAICAAIILIVTPLQAAAEEYVFRGLLAQALGSWIRFAPIGWIITTALFVSGHVYDAWGLLSVGAFGFGAAVVVSRTGGLEAGIALHSVNNIASFLVLASGVQGTTVNPTASSADLAGNLLGVGIALLTTAAWVFWIDRLAKRRKLATLGGMLPAPAPAPPPAPPPPAAPDAGISSSSDPAAGK